MTREKSSSITHLVKIVAAEVFEEKIKERRIYTIEEMEDLSAIGSSFCESIRSSLGKAGELWTRDEDNLLVQEVRTAVAQIAKNHHRSVGGIGARINQKELIRS